MKKLLKRCIAATMASTILLTGCMSQPASMQTQVDDSSLSASSVSKKDVISMKNISVIVEKSALYGDKVKISSSFNQFTAKTTSLVKGNQEKLNINELSPQLITLQDDTAPGKTPLALSVVANPSRSQTVLISPQSTAEALVFMNPAIATTELELGDKIMSIIKAQPETAELAKIIEARSGDKDFLYKEDQRQNDALSRAVNSVVNKLADEFERNTAKEDPTNRVAGVEINVLDQNALTATFELKNYKKRMSALHFMTTTGRDMYTETLQSAYDFIDINNLSLGRKPFVKTGGYDIQMKMDKVEIIGMGLKDISEFKEKWPSMSQQDKMKYGMPIAQGLMSDFISPVISIFMGFNVNKVYHVGLMKIVTGLPIIEIVNDFRNKAYGAAFKALLSGAIKTLLDKNGALLRELLIAAGLNLTDAILQRLNAAVGIFNLVRYAIEAARALYAYTTCKIDDFFKVDYSTGKIQFTKFDGKN